MTTVEEQGTPAAASPDGAVVVARELARTYGEGATAVDTVIRYLAVLVMAG